jgi:hypothetical protein
MALHNSGQTSSGTLETIGVSLWRSYLAWTVLVTASRLAHANWIANHAKLVAWLSAKIVGESKAAPHFESADLLSGLELPVNCPVVSFV